MPNDIDPITILLNNCVDEMWRKIEAEQSTEAGRKARQERRYLWTLQNAIYVGIRNGGRNWAEEYEHKRYGH